MYDKHIPVNKYTFSLCTSRINKHKHSHTLLLSQRLNCGNFEQQHRVQCPSKHCMNLHNRHNDSSISIGCPINQILHNSITIQPSIGDMPIKILRTMSFLQICCPFPPIPFSIHFRIFLCKHTAVYCVRILLFLPFVDRFCCSVRSIMPSQFPLRSLHTAYPLLSPTMCRDQIPDEYQLHVIAPEMDIDNFTEGNFYCRRIGGDRETFTYRLYSLPISGGNDRAIGCVLEKVARTPCNFQGCFVGSFWHA